jgi:hypothetical protein
MSTPWNRWPNGPVSSGTRRSHHSLAMRLATAVLCMGVGGLAGYGVGSTPVVGNTPAVGSTPAPAVAQALPPCPTEDSVEPCFWDASQRSNGRGRSFVVLPDCWVQYADGELARRKLSECA